MSTATGLQIAHAFERANLRIDDCMGLDVPGTESYVTSASVLDFDYLMSYLLEVRDGGCTTWLACFYRHGAHPIHGYDKDVQWFDGFWKHDELDLDAYWGQWRKAHHWWVTWSEGSVESYEIRRRRTGGER